MNVEEIKEYRKRNNLTQTQLADIVKSSTRAVQSWEQGHRNITQSAIELMKLFEGEGEMLKSKKEDKEEEEITGYYYPSVSASAGLDNMLFNAEIEKIPMYLPQFGKGIDYINVYGDSMYPKYNAGEVIGIKLIEFKYLNYGYPYVVLFKNGDVYIKYVRAGRDENHILLKSENPLYEPREFHLDLIKCFYSIRGVIKKEMM